MTEIALEEAQARLPELIAGLAPGSDLLILLGNEPVAQLSRLRAPVVPQFGGCRGMLEIVEDDDEHLADFAEYIP